MFRSLPTAIELEKLPLRAIVAYGARSAQRLSAQLRGEISDEMIDDLLSRVGAVCTTCFLGELDESSLAAAARNIVSELRSTDLSKSSTIIALSLSEVAMAAFVAIQAANDPSRIDECIKYAAKRAETAVRAIRILEIDARNSAASAAIRDYEVLLDEFGANHQVSIGDPIDFFSERDST